MRDIRRIGAPGSDELLAFLRQAAAEAERILAEARGLNDPACVEYAEERLAMIWRGLDALETARGCRCRRVH